MYKQIPEAKEQIIKEIREGKTHKEILIHIAKIFDYKSYLEIGTQDRNNTFNHIPCENKVCVDPDPQSKADYICTSREYWESMNNSGVHDIYHEISDYIYHVDLIFIDGKHEYKESKNDLKEALKHLSTNGTIVMHDANPWSEETQRVPRETKQWNGDVWKTIIAHVALANHLVYTIDTDFGVCCIHPFAPREQESRNLTFTYEIFEKDKNRFLNLITLEEWYKKIKDISLLAQADS